MIAFMNLIIFQHASFLLINASLHPCRFGSADQIRSEEHTSELQSHSDLVCRLLLEKKKKAIAATGLTEMHDAGAEGSTIACVRELIDEGKFPIRVYIMLSDSDALEQTWFAQKPLIDYGGRVTVRAAEL